MITTGQPFSSATRTEIVDVVSGETCGDLADFPLTNFGAVGANLHGTPVVCGGYVGSTSYQKCYKFSGGGWQGEIGWYIPGHTISCPITRHTIQNLFRRNFPKS